MDTLTKKQIGLRLREMREQAGYTREQLGELCGLSPRFIANIEFGDSAFSLDSLITICRVLSCTSDSLLFGGEKSAGNWDDLCDKLRQINPRYYPAVSKLINGLIETIVTAENET